MPFKTAIDPKTGKIKTYSITGTGRVWLENGKLIQPGAQIPQTVKREAEAIKTRRR
jgi:hypothetical protein